MPAGAIHLARSLLCATAPLQTLSRPIARARLRWFLSSTTPLPSSIPSTSTALPCPPAPRRALHLRSALLLKKKVLNPPPSSAPSTAPATPAAPPPTSSPPPRPSKPTTPLPPLPSIRATLRPSACTFTPSSPSASPSPPSRAAQRPKRSRSRRFGSVSRFIHRRAHPIDTTRKLNDSPDDRRFDWRVAVLIERLPRVLNPPPAWEVEWESWSDALERRQAVPFPRELYDSKLDEPEPPKPLLPTTTDDDTAGRLQSLDRSLNRALFLLLQRKNQHTGEVRWTLPSVPYRVFPWILTPPRDAAAQAIVDTVGSKLDVHLLGSAPIAYHRYAYSQAYTDKSGTAQQGCKMLIMHGVYCAGLVDATGGTRDVVDWAWLTREQVMERLDDDELRCILLDVMMEDVDYAEGIDTQELERRKEYNQRYWAPPPENQSAWALRLEAARKEERRQRSTSTAGEEDEEKVEDGEDEDGEEEDEDGEGEEKEEESQGVPTRTRSSE